MKGFEFEGIFFVAENVNAVGKVLFHEEDNVVTHQYFSVFFGGQHLKHKYSEEKEAQKARKQFINKLKRALKGR